MKEKTHVVAEKNEVKRCIVGFSRLQNHLEQYFYNLKKVFFPEPSKKSCVDVKKHPNELNCRKKKSRKLKRGFSSGYRKRFSTTEHC